MKWTDEALAEGASCAQLLVVPRYQFRSLLLNNSRTERQRPAVQTYQSLCLELLNFFALTHEQTWLKIHVSQTDQDRRQGEVVMS